MNSKIDLIFPCAGKAERFGGTFKPFLTIGDLTFVEKAYEPFHKWSEYIENVYFIITEEQEQRYNVSSKLKDMFQNVPHKVSILDKQTDGPLQTFKHGYVDKFKSKNSFIVCDCDHSIDVDNLFSQINNSSADIVIPTWNITEETQKNWSKILLQNNNILKFVNKEDVDFKKYTVKGIIGCIYFNSTDLFANTKQEYANFYEIIYDNFARNKNIILNDAKNAYFFGDHNMLSDCVDKRRDECSIFCDIDGVLLEHKDCSTNEPETNIALNGFNKLKNLSQQNHKIILTTARSEKFRSKLIKLLQQKEIYYDELIMGLPAGPRILINDRKPSKPFTKQATSFEVQRNKGLCELNIENITLNNKINVIKDMSANSFAKTYLVNLNGRTFVRKHIFKKNNEKHYNVLKRQKTDLERFNFLVPGICPPVLSEVDNEIEYYYDMQYLPSYFMASDYRSSEQKITILNKLLSKLDKHVYSFSKQVDGDKWMNDFLKEKIYPKFENYSLLNKEFRVIIQSEEITINNKKYVGLEKLFQSLPYSQLSPKTISVVHGDLTLENIMYDYLSGEIKLIDMDGSRLFDAKELDLGKMSQSIISKYSSWKNLSCSELVNMIDIKERSFFVNDEYFYAPDSELQDELIKQWENILDETYENVFYKACFYMSTYFIRFVPFRMQLGKEHGIFALLMATVWLNKIILGEKN